MSIFLEVWRGILWFEEQSKGHFSWLIICLLEGVFLLTVAPRLKNLSFLRFLQKEKKRSFDTTKYANPVYKAASILMFATAAVEFVDVIIAVRSSNAEFALKGTNMKLAPFNFVVIVLWICYYRVIGYIEAKEKKFHDEFVREGIGKPSEMALSFLGFCRITSIIILFVTFLMCGFGVSNVLEVVGAVGAVIAFTSRSFFMNIWGGFMIFVNRPFWLNERVMFIDKQKAEVEGVVEEIAWQSTKVRTDDDAYFSLANSVIAAMGIKNYSRKKTQTEQVTAVKQEDKVSDRFISKIKSTIAKAFKKQKVKQDVS
ncbi:MAG: mechanosensitive ion channel [Rickettsiales bacterium]|nr:mechanosensitive ion channel [Rickettsiales bacterium]